MFVKPHTGSNARSAFAIERMGDGAYRIEGGVHDEAYVTGRLREALREGALLVQQRLVSAPELADLTTAGVPPTLRIITACEPGGQPFMHSALFSIRVPGEQIPIPTGR
jgi:hypothetical protein